MVIHSNDFLTFAGKDFKLCCFEFNRIVIETHLISIIRCLSGSGDLKREYIRVSIVVWLIKMVLFVIFALTAI